MKARPLRLLIVDNALPIYIKHAPVRITHTNTPELLHRFKMWSVATEIINACEIPSVLDLNQVRVFPYLV